MSTLFTSSADLDVLVNLVDLVGLVEITDLADLADLIDLPGHVIFVDLVDLDGFFTPPISDLVDLVAFVDLVNFANLVDFSVVRLLSMVLFYIFS